MSLANKKVYFQTFGCRLNRSESAMLTKNLEALHYSPTQHPEEADLAVLNTCTVTHRSDSHCMQAIRSFRGKNPQAVLAVVGCLAQMDSANLRKIPGVNLILGNSSKFALPQYLEGLTATSEPLVVVERISAKSFTHQSNGQQDTRARANLKIQDGCDFACSFCIIPFARGRSRCREFDDLLAEAQLLAANQVKEVVLTGVNIGLYEYKGLGFIDVLDALESVEGIERIRISSIEPTTVDERVFGYMQSKKSKLTPYLHLPLQSGSNAILQAMRRRYVIEEYAAFIQAAHEAVPNLCVGTDVLTGFPGESEVHFAQTLEALQEMPVHYFHVFPYSERQGVRSTRLPDKVAPEVIKSRAGKLRELSAAKRKAYTRSFVGQDLDVLFESQDALGSCSGYSDNFIRVNAYQPHIPMQNRIRPVRISGVSGEVALGEVQQSGIEQGIS